MELRVEDLFAFLSKKSDGNVEEFDFVCGAGGYLGGLIPGVYAVRIFWKLKVLEFELAKWSVCIRARRNAVEIRAR